VRPARGSASRASSSLRLAPSFVGQIGVFDLRAKLDDLAAASFALAELALDGLELLAQVKTRAVSWRDALRCRS
jgi:hypothetical protein